MEILKEKPIVIQTKFGEQICCTTEDTDPCDDTNIDFLVVEYPAVLVPQQNGQLGFQLAFPFSDHDKPLKIKKADICKFSELANEQICEAYTGWKKQVKAQMSGLIVPTGAQVATPDDLRQEG